MIVTTGLTFGFMFKYMTKYQTLARTDTLDAFHSEQDQPFAGKTINQGAEMSLDPQDYGMIKYTDLEIATHSIMVDGLPRNIPRRDLEQKLKQIFKQIANSTAGKSVKERRIEEIENSDKIMQVVVISDYGKCLKMANDLKLNAGKFKSCVKENS